MLRVQKLRVQNFGISLDGYSAGPNQSLAHPLGVGGMALGEWFFPTRTFQRMHNPDWTANLPDHILGGQHGVAGIDDYFAARGFENVGALIIGRNMFGPIRGAWANEDWKGWWGDTPPFHCDVFVLTHHARASLPMQGGTTFHFVTDGIEAALQRAKTAAKGKDVQLGGGVATVRAYLRAGLVDELHLAQSPVLLGSGESLFAGLDLLSLGYRCVERVPSSKTTHVVLAKS
jgi:dihydrofolate reductase